MIQTIFILGFSRSGTTFLQSLIATQPRIVSIPETHFFDLVTEHIECGNSIYKEEIEQIYSNLKKFLNFEFLPSQKHEIELELTHENLSKKRLFHELIKGYCEREEIDLESDSIFLEKTPDHARAIKEIGTIFPNAYFFSIFRHPVIAIQSHREKLLLYKDTYEELAHSWVNNVKNVLSFSKQFPEKIFLIKFENFKLNYVERLQSCFDEMGLRFEQECLNRYSEEAKKIVLPYETWKSSNTKATFTESNEDAYVKKMPLLKLLKIQKIMMNEMKALEYPLYYARLQKIYNSLSNVYISLIKYISKN